jgi:hypothetical protein
MSDSLVQRYTSARNDVEDLWKILRESVKATFGIAGAFNFGTFEVSRAGLELIINNALPSFEPNEDERKELRGLGFKRITVRYSRPEQLWERDWEL